MKRLCSGNSKRIYLSSIFPHTPFNGLKAANGAATSAPKSPACHTSSHASKCLNTASSRYPWVSDINPIRFNSAVLNTQSLKYQEKILQQTYVSCCIHTLSGVNIKIFMYSCCSIKTKTNHLPNLGFTFVRMHMDDPVGK